MLFRSVVVEFFALCLLARSLAHTPPGRRHSELARSRWLVGWLAERACEMAQQAFLAAAARILLSSPATSAPARPLFHEPDLSDEEQEEDDEDTTTLEDGGAGGGSSGSGDVGSRASGSGLTRPSSSGSKAVFQMPVASRIPVAVATTRSDSASISTKTTSLAGSNSMVGELDTLPGSITDVQPTQFWDRACGAPSTTSTSSSATLSQCSSTMPAVSNAAQLLGAALGSQHNELGFTIAPPLPPPVVATPRTKPPVPATAASVGAQGGANTTTTPESTGHRDQQQHYQSAATTHKRAKTNKQVAHDFREYAARRKRPASPRIIDETSTTDENYQHTPKRAKLAAPTSHERTIMTRASSSSSSICTVDLQDADTTTSRRLTRRASSRDSVSSAASSSSSSSSSSRRFSTRNNNSNKKNKKPSLYRQFQEIVERSRRQHNNNNV